MHPSPLLWPVIVLIAWSQVMLIWMAVARVPQLRGREIPNGARGVDLERADPGRRNWPAHNYQHLMEQPTLFYAIVLTLVLMGFDARVNLWLAWGYVGFRIAHSLVQATVNVVRYRFLLFLASTICLVCLTVHAILFMLHHG